MSNKHYVLDKDGEQIVKMFGDYKGNTTIVFMEKNQMALKKLNRKQIMQLIEGLSTLDENYTEYALKKKKKG